MKIIGLNGISGSGKTHLLKKLQAEWQGRVSVLSFDNYYKPIEFQKKDANGYENFDLPEGVDTEKFLKDLDSLKRGEPVKIKVYQFNNPDAEETYIEIQPAPFLFVEGLFVFYFSEVFAQLDYKIFLNASLEITLNRRLKRDRLERGISEALIRYQWEHHALPGFERYVNAFKHRADILIDNEENSELAYQSIVKLLEDSFDY